MREHEERTARSSKEVIARLVDALADRYAVEREIGRGGMARVYLAHYGPVDPPDDALGEADERLRLWASTAEAAYHAAMWDLRKQVRSRVPLAPREHVPSAYYNDRQRQAIKEAGRLIDLDVVHILNEPFKVGWRGDDLYVGWRHPRLRGARSASADWRSS